VNKLDYEFTLLVFLAGLERMLILPAESGFARVTINIGDRV